MSPAHQIGSDPCCAPPAAKSTLSVTSEKITVRLQEKLGFESWKSIFVARQMASEKHLPLQVEVGQCNDADMAGIGSLLIAIDQLGGISVVGCNERSRNWFSNLGICRGCTNRTTNQVCVRYFSRRPAHADWATLTNDGLPVTPAAH